MTDTYIVVWNIPYCTKEIKGFDQYDKAEDFYREKRNTEQCQNVGIYQVIREDME